MKTKKDKILIILLIALLSTTLLLTIIFFKNKTKTPEKIIVSKIQDNGIVEDITYDIFKMENIKYIINKESKSTEIVLTINNTSNKKEYLKEFKIIIKNSKNEKIDYLNAYIDREFEAGEQLEFITMTDIIINDGAILEFNFE